MVLRFPGRAQHILAILVNHLTDFQRVQARLRPDVSDGAAEANIVAHEIDSFGIFEQIIDIGLTDAEAAVDIPTVVGFFAISHVPCSVRNKVC
jgi:hypothetical protein